MVPLQAESLARILYDMVKAHTKFLLDDLENLLLIKLLRKTLNGGQCLTTIALYRQLAVSKPPTYKKTYVEFVYECNSETV